MNEAYGIKERGKAVAFVDMVDKYLEWSKENKKSWLTDEHRAKPLKRIYKRKLMTDINPFILEKYKVTRAKEVTKATVNKKLILGSQVFKKALEWESVPESIPFLRWAATRSLRGRNRAV
jgi:hypothetical protein